MNEACLSLGSNIGDRMNMLEEGLRLISAQCGSVTKRSSVYETAAWGKTDQPPFLNMAAALQTDLSATGLLHAIRNIEAALGRQRDVKWGPRTLDIDMLLFNNEIINTPELVIPHAYMPTRRFVLEPLAEIAGGRVHPVSGKTIAQLLAGCTDLLEIRKYMQQ